MALVSSGPFSNEATATPEDGTETDGVIDSLTATGANASVDLQWTLTNQRNSTHILIWRKLASAPVEDYKNVAYLSIDPVAGQWIDGAQNATMNPDWTHVVNGFTYVYKVQAVTII